MAYVYRMVQFPPNIAATPGQEGEVAAYLESTVNAHAKQGWEFYSVETIGLPARNGRPEYSVITFRAQVQ
jgi:hypothetical protein